MEFMTAKEAAEKWNVSVRLIQSLLLIKTPLQIVIKLN